MKKYTNEYKIVIMPSELIKELHPIEVEFSVSDNMYETAINYIVGQHLPGYMFKSFVVYKRHDDNTWLEVERLDIGKTN